MPFDLDHELVINHNTSSATTHGGPAMNFAHIVAAMVATLIVI